ncbi:hypothetical protein ACOME3_009131 [Neoechinorhynchus agilis]
MQNKMLSRRAHQRLISSKSTESPVLTATNKLASMLSDPKNVLKWNLTVYDLNNLKRLAVWIKGEEGVKTVARFKSKRPETLDCLDALLQLLVDDNNTKIISVNDVNKTGCTLYKNESTNHKRSGNVKRLVPEDTRNESFLHKKVTPWKLCSSKLRIRPRHAHSTCWCQNKASRRHRYACYQCECHNITSIGHIPGIVRENVLELRLIDFKGKSLLRRSLKITDFINTQSLTIKGSLTLDSIRSIDLMYMMNLQTLFLSDLPNLNYIDPHIFTQQSLSQISHFIVHNTGLSILSINETYRTQLENVTLDHNRILCGYSGNCWLFESGAHVNAKKQVINVSLDKCIYRNIEFDPQWSNCGNCLDHVCPDQSICTAVDNVAHCSETNTSFNIEICYFPPLPQVCACTGTHCECNGLNQPRDAESIDVPDIRSIHFSSMQSVVLDSKWLCALPQLKELEISQVGEIEIEAGAFRTNVLMESLKVIGKIGLVSVLKIDNNSFSNSSLNAVHIENIYEGFLLHSLLKVSDKLQELSINNARMTKVPTNLSNFTALRRIDFKSNLIKQVDGSLLMQLPYLYRFNLEDNPLDCSCTNAWIHKAMTEVDIGTNDNALERPVIDFGNVKCKMSEQAYADLFSHNPCNICSSFDCGLEFYCEQDLYETSRCYTIDIVEHGSRHCFGNRSDLFAVDGTCHQFHLCADRDTSFVMRCPPKLKFDLETLRCIPADIERDGILCYSSSNQIAMKKISLDQIHMVISGFTCPSNIVGMGYHAMNRHLQDAWDEIPDNSDSREFETIVQFIQYHGIFRHDQLDCQGYHRCHYNNITGEFLYTTPNRCPMGTVFDSQYDMCMDAMFNYMKTNPDPISQCRCNLAIYQHRYIQHFRKEYSVDPVSIPFTTYDDYDNGDPCLNINANPYEI